MSFADFSSSLTILPTIPEVPSPPQSSASSTSSRSIVITIDGSPRSFVSASSVSTHPSPDTPPSVGETLRNWKSLGDCMMELITLYGSVIERLVDEDKIVPEAREEVNVETDDLIKYRNEVEVLWNTLKGEGDGW